MKYNRYKVIFGPAKNYRDLVDQGLIETLKSRQETAVLKFANKAVNSPRFGPEWFKEIGTVRGARQTTRNKFVEKQVRTERGRNNPIQFITRMLNKQHRT